jgi:hypothetical protein
LSPGTVLLTIVPADEPLRAEVWVGNEDRGFVREGQTVKLKIHPYPFQKSGMIEGVVKRLSADALEPWERDAKDAVSPGFKFRSIVDLVSGLGVRRCAHPLAIQGCRSMLNSVGRT